MSDPVVTPEAVALDLEPATVGSRSVAILLDYLLIGAALLVLGAAQAAFGLGGLLPGWLGVALVLLLVFAVQFGYPIGFETLWHGRTPGKAVMGLRVVTVEGAPVGFRHAAVRAAVGLLELQATLGGIAVIASFASSRGQRLGDLAAGALVVRERRASQAPEAVRFAPPRGLESYVAALDVSRLDARDYATIRDLLRRPMQPEVRERVARDVAASVVERVQPPPPDGVDAVVWLQAVAAAVQGRGAAGAGRAPAHAPPPAASSTAAPPSSGSAPSDGPPPPPPATGDGRAPVEGAPSSPARGPDPTSPGDEPGKAPGGDGPEGFRPPR